MSPSRGLAVLAAVAAVSLSACTNQDADAGDVVDALTDVDVPEDQARCIGNGFEDEFDQDQLNDLAAADDPDEYPSGTEETVTSIINECTAGAQSGGGESDSGSETTTTTTTEGN